MRPRSHILYDELKRAQAEMSALIADLDAGSSAPELIRHAFATRRALARFNRRLLSACVRQKAVDAAGGNVAALDELARLFATMPRVLCWRCRIALNQSKKPKE